MLGCFAVIVTRLKNEKKIVILTQTKKHVFFKIPKNRDIPNTPPRFLYFYTFFVESILNLNQ